MDYAHKLPPRFTTASLPYSECVVVAMRGRVADDGGGVVVVVV